MPATLPAYATLSCMDSGSLAFDWIAERYDDTRTLSEAARREVVDLLRPELDRRRPCLEVGVGTGRIALPLHDAGVAMVGVDLSEPMLRRLVDKSAGAQPFPLVRADASVLPFANDAFGSAVCAWILHLVPAWRRVLGELVRVIAPGGTIAVTLGSFGQGLWRALQEHFVIAAGGTMQARGVTDPDELDASMESLGAVPRLLGTLQDVRRHSLEELISLLERGTYSFTKHLDEHARRRAGRRTRAWAAEQLGDLGGDRDLVVPMEWRAYDLKA